MVLALLLLCGAALAEESTSGATALTNADYQQIVSTYSIDASIPGYADYLERYEDAAHPDVTVTVDADTFVATRMQALPPSRGSLRTTRAWRARAS